MSIDDAADSVEADDAAMVPPSGDGGDVGPCSTAPFPSTPTLDAFDQPDGSAPSSQWIAAVPNAYTINGGHLRNVDSNVALYWATAFGADQEAFVKVEQFDPNLYEIALLFKAQRTDTDCESIQVSLSQIQNGIFVGHCTNRSHVIDGDMAYVPLHAGMEIGARAFASGCVDVYFDRQWVLTAYVPAWTSGTGGSPWLGSPGRVGVYAQPEQSGNVSVPTEFDDFGGGSIAP
jgi:hypothetical protein